MSASNVILITGAAGYWGGQVARLLAARPDMHIIGVDAVPLPETIKGLDFIQADVRNARFLDLLEAEHVDTLVHLAFIESRRPSEHAFDSNVMGTMKIFGAARAAGVKKIVLRSSTAVYGARATNSAFLRESHPLRGSTQTGWIRDLVEIEAFCNGFRMQASDICLTILRFPNVIGPTISTPMTRYLSLRTPPVLLGFEPQMQFLHETDAIQALVQAVDTDVPGIFNIGAETAVPLDKALAITGRLPLPIFHLFAYWGSAFLGSSTQEKVMPFELDYIRYPWVGDLQRMHEEFNFTPQYTAEEALREFAGQQRLSAFKPGAETDAQAEERLQDILERRSRQRASGQTDSPILEEDEQEEEEINE